MYYNNEVIRGKLEILFTKEKEFNNFSEISKEEILELREALKEKRKPFKTRGEWITNTMQSILDPRNVNRIKDFDRKLVYLIEAIDPNCYTYKKFAMMGKPMNKRKVKEINELPEAEKTKKLAEERKLLTEYKMDIETNVGVYEPKLIKYETAYLSHLNRIKLGIKESLVDILFLITINPSDINFDSVSSERYQEIKSQSKEISIYSVQPLNSLITSIKYQTSLLEEKIIEMICCLDQNLDILGIYDNGSQWAEIYQELRKIKKIGISSSADKELLNILIKLETILNKKYQITDNIGNWSI